MKKFMEAALEEARKALMVGEVPVGCVFIYNGEIVARGSNDVNATKNATRHAEFVCIDQIMDYCLKSGLNWKNIIFKVSVIVTVEPCIMCLSALYNLGVKEIIYGCSNDRFGGKTVVDVENIHEKKLNFTAGYRSDEAMELLKDFYKGENPSAPITKSKR